MIYVQLQLTQYCAKQMSVLPAPKRVKYALLLYP